MPKTDSEDESDQIRSPRHSRAQRKNLAGMDLDPEGEDDEYHEGEEDFDETNIKEEDDEDEEMEEEDDEDDVPAKPRRGRKRKAATEEPEEDLNENDDHNEDNEDPNEDDTEIKEEGKTEEEKAPIKRKGKKRGRKPKIPRPEDVFFDEKGNEIKIKNDEVVIEDEDPKGLEKIDENGFLKGDRKFRIKTFTLLGKGDRQYMVSTEPARLVGFRDSYLLFKTHLSLFKKVCTHEEKMDLIQRHLIPTSYKGRSVNLVTARSIFREFGARMIVGGKKVVDDFWEQKAIDRGDVSGEYADPEEAASTMGGSSYGTGDHNPYQAQVTGSALINYQTDPTWMYQVSLQTLEFNKTLTEQRNQVWLRGVKDTYSGFNFYPLASQPTRSRLDKIAPAHDDETIECSIKYYNPDIRRKVTGLASVPKEIFDDLEDEEVKKAILEQQEYERRAEKL
ncbi:putative chromatin structure-remodeling complex subunit [Clavispora lusitaniae]|uniref:Chromatin structure-remodeling complex subunit n=3 Tax=Clavispora lusitaniae TaxID=36911 RepID=C4Y5J7_CLAL4|nr:uncharacterized protein CLUG_03431 [Clavispora lusitaniae ATCC 42720]KAF5210205.1 hypothetical protein E0198_003072 [Clavispora lusitaniae]EEQ39303.1 hypothetical protein CLUG_03431 [Clavispora lusitaniae ATCC 42720]KAF7582720.1 Chromatin remodelling complex Rsc7/Swp82 subunit family protein [Clavispora lusitaniae]OVF11265.1 putative chromatin structure-remodeling complex subunit [Clavispora lusitaniae]QFZ28196.1 putative chromatin structure-remodeling complex subunit [Clavispora lusitaniae